MKDEEEGNYMVVKGNDLEDCETKRKEKKPTGFE